MSVDNYITIKGARSHNLKDVGLKIKKHKISCLAAQVEVENLLWPTIRFTRNRNDGF